MRIIIQSTLIQIQARAKRFKLSVRVPKGVQKKTFFIRVRGIVQLLQLTTNVGRKLCPCLVAVRVRACLDHPSGEELNHCCHCRAALLRKCLRLKEDEVPDVVLRRRRRRRRRPRCVRRRRRSWRRWRGVRCIRRPRCVRRWRRGWRRWRAHRDVVGRTGTDEPRSLARPRASGHVTV